MAEYILNQVASEVQQAINKALTSVQTVNGVKPDESGNVRIEVGGADWNQNDPKAPDYVKNRPFYSEFEEIVVENVAEAPLEGFPVFAVGDTVTVKVDGVEYNLVAYDDDGYATIGDTWTDLEDGTGSMGWQIYYDEYGSFFATEERTVSYQAEVPHKLNKKYLPPEVPFMQNGLIPLNYVLPNASEVFGGVLAVGGTYSTLAKPYPNKKILKNLTLESFNAMLDGSIPLPNLVMVGNNMASVSLDVSTSQIKVHWSDYGVYHMSGVGLAGASVTVYHAIIHEDTDNPGTIVSEYAMIKVVDTPLT